MKTTNRCVESTVYEEQTIDKDALYAYVHCLADSTQIIEWTAIWCGWTHRTSYVCEVRTHTSATVNNPAHA
jgi:hypothetical protein